jgi:hypothetical protein
MKLIQRSVFFNFLIDNYQFYNERNASLFVKLNRGNLKMILSTGDFKLSVFCAQFQIESTAAT